MAFKLIKYVPWKVTEWINPEPLFLPTLLPFCLIGNNFLTEGIGFGYSTTIPCFEPSDLYKRLLFLLKIKSNF
jgi:DNA gyrase/topoisomerase IV subunit A